MELSSSQIEEFEERGFLFFPELLKSHEVKLLTDRLEGLYSRTGPEVVREKKGDGIRLVYGTHEYCQPYGRLSVLPRLLQPVRKLLRSEVYIHQSRLNPKHGFSGGAWNWHQDFGTWHREDGMPEPKCVMTAVLLHESGPVNSPLLLIPGSHRIGMTNEVKPEEGATGYTVMEIDENQISDLAERHGIEAIIGKPGGVAYIHCNLVHGSAPNISPWPRAILYINYNSIDNQPTGGNDRAWFHNNPNREALLAQQNPDLEYFFFQKRELRYSKRPVEGVFSGLPAGWWLRQKRF